MQSNTLIFSFLAQKKLDAAQLTVNKVPEDTLDKLLSEHKDAPKINLTIKEHLSYKTYLEAHEAFSEWFKQFNSKPIPPEEVSENAPFTEKVVHEHRVSQFKAELDRWILTTRHLAKSAKTALYNVLLFPEGGWLVGAKNAELLRATCIPEITLLLYSVLHESKMYDECVQMADILASEKYGLYKVIHF